MHNETDAHDEACLLYDPWGGWCDCGAEKRAKHAAHCTPTPAPSLLFRALNNCLATLPRSIAALPRRVLK